MRAIRRSSGFTLIELMIVVAIIGIIAAIAYPSYIDYVKNARRADAQTTLMGLASAMERYRTANNTYKNAGASGDTGAPTIYADESPVDGSPKFYDLTIKSSSGSEYVLRATPKNAQAGDGVLELSSTGARWWDENGNGSADAGERTWRK